MSGDLLKKLTGGPQNSPPVCQNPEVHEYCCTDTSCYEWYNTVEATCQIEVDPNTGTTCQEAHTAACFCN